MGFLSRMERKNTQRVIDEIRRREPRLSISLNQIRCAQEPGRVHEGIFIDLPPRAFIGLYRCTLIWHYLDEGAPGHSPWRRATPDAVVTAGSILSLVTAKAISMEHE